MYAKAAPVEGDWWHVNPNGDGPAIVDITLLRRRVEAKARLRLEVCVVGSGHYASLDTSRQHATLYAAPSERPLYSFTLGDTQGRELELDRPVGNMVSDWQLTEVVDIRELTATPFGLNRPSSSAATTVTPLRTFTGPVSL